MAWYARRQVLAHEVNVGYEGFSNMQLLSFNGERVKSLRHLVHLADANREEYLRFDLFRDRVVVLEAAGVPEATLQICRDNSIPSPRSADLVVADAAEADAADDSALLPPPPPLAGVEMGEAETEGSGAGSLEEPERQQHPTAGLNGGKQRQPQISGGAAVPARRRRGLPRQQKTGTRGGGGGAGAGAGGAEPRRRGRGSRSWTAAAAAVGRVGAASSAASASGPRTEEGRRAAVAAAGRWLARARRGKEARSADTRTGPGRREEWTN